MKFFNFKKALSQLLGQTQNSCNLDEIEEILYLMDISSKTVEWFMEALRKEALSSSFHREKEDSYTNFLKQKTLLLFQNLPPPSFPPSFPFSSDPKGFYDFYDMNESQRKKKPQFWMFTGANGVGKTTCIGKLAFYLGQKHKVLIIAGDTFRAAATQQLEIWSQKAQVDFFTSTSTKDPSALAFQASEYALSKSYDFALLDTAGRLSHQSPLMDELKKTKRVIQKVLPFAPQQVFVVLDAHSGQNALLQAQIFDKALSLTGVILNKLDGSAKGGVTLSLTHELKLPIYWLGTGEKREDLKAFHAEEFVSSLFQ